MTITDSGFTIFIGMNNTSCEAEIPLSVVEELGTDRSTSKGCACTCTCGKLGLTNTGVCTIQEQHGEKRSLVIDNLSSETNNAGKRICLDDATVNFSSSVSPFQTDISFRTLFISDYNFSIVFLLLRFLRQLNNKPNCK